MSGKTNTMNLTLLEFAQKCLVDVDHDYFSYVETKGANLTLTTTYPTEWQERYFSQNYQAHDYGLLKSSFLPFAWGEKISRDASPLQRQIFKEAQDLKICKGITVPFSSPAAPGVISIAFSNGGKFTKSEILTLTSDLIFSTHLIRSYAHLLEQPEDTKEDALKLINEVATWQKDKRIQRKNYEAVLGEALSDIRAAQMFISHHETKELGLEALHRVYKDIERLA